VRRSHLQICAASLALTAGMTLAAPASAPAAQDELSGGTVTLEATDSKALKLKPSSLELPITSGAVDPVAGDGAVKAAGALRVKAGKRKAQVSITAFSFGANGGSGTISAKIGKKRVKGFGDLSGGTVVRDGLGARISGVAASLGADGAKALSRALKTKSKGGARAGGSGKIKAGEPLGSVSATTIPKTVEVLPGGSMTLHTDPDLLTKLLAHCINALPGSGGVYPIAPATQDPVSAAFTFPVTGGAMAPSLADGKVVTGGGQGLTKNVGGTIPYPCNLDPAVGTTVIQSELTTNFAGNSLAATVQLPGGTQVSTIANIDFSTGTRSFDPATNQITVTGATVTLHPLAATILNQIFPNRSGDPSNDLSEADVLGTLDLTATLR
jgi:hypothetical protein